MKFFTAGTILSCILFISHPVAAQHSEASFTQMFDGRSLEGWKGDKTYWRVENNTIIGETTPEKVLKVNTFLIYDVAQPGDFELRGEFRITAVGNSGIQYRSEMVEGVPYALKGYQADIDGENVYTGQNYEERGRGFLAKRGEEAVLEKLKKQAIVAHIGDGDSLKSLIKKVGWNQIRIVAKGNRVRHYINGVLMSEITDNDTQARKMNGLIGLQVHAGPPMKVEYRNLRIAY